MERVGRVGFITGQEDGSLAIERMILHVVGTDGFTPQPEMAVEQGAFFVERIRNAAVDGVHLFNKGSLTQKLVEEMAARKVPFESGGQGLADSFSRLHVGTSADGAFFVFQLATHDPATKLFSLIKYDYRLVLELVTGKGAQHLREVVQAFVKEPRAIQKSCLIRVRGGIADELVSAFDRMGRTPDLTDYFGRFLDVRRERSDDELSSALNEALRATLSEVQPHLPKRDVIAALEIGKDSLRGRAVVDDSAIREAVFVAAGSPDDEAIRNALDAATDRQLGRHRLGGVAFHANPAVLAKRPRRRIKTAEGVTVVYPGEEEGQSVHIRAEDGGSVITIRTKVELVENDTLADKSR
jgi:hypothetical protein